MMVILIKHLPALWYVMKSLQETFAIISSLCGVNIKFDNNYVYNLKKAITKYTVNKRLIEKIGSCPESCAKDKNGKFNCQASCPFDAIIYDKKEKSAYIDSDRCLSCGLCVDSCKDGLLLDKVYFIPVADLIKNNKTVI